MTRRWQQPIRSARRSEAAAPDRAAAATIALLVVLSSLAPTAAAAQPAGGTIVGRVTTGQGVVLPVATVSAVSLTVPGTRTTVTDGSGDFLIAHLEPGTYTISAALTGFAVTERPDVVVREGLTIAVSVQLAPGAISDRVTVHADPPMVDPTSPTTAVNIRAELQRAVPLSSLRSWSDLLLMAPGVSTTQARLQTYMLHGATQASGVYRVDGADVTSVLQGSTLYAQFASDTFNDVQVKTNGIDAASPLGFGPIVNITSRSGSNTWHGSLELAYQADRWNDRNAAGGETMSVRVNQQDAAAGGPLRPDHWWVFGSVRFARNATGVPRSATQLSLLRQIAPTFTAFENPWSGEFGFVKLTARPSPRHTLLASASHDVLTLGGAQPNEAAMFRDVLAGGPGAFARLLSGWSSSLLTNVSVGYNGRKQENRNRTVGATGVVVHQHVFPVAGRLAGTGALAVLGGSPAPGVDFDVAMWTIAADLTHVRQAQSGAHEIRAGLQLQPVRRNRWETQYDNGGFQLEEAVLRDPDVPAAGFVPFHRQYFAVERLITRHVDSRDTAFYVQDEWRVRPSVTISAGVRVDRITRVDRLLAATTQRTTAVGPRFGIVLVPAGDEHGVVRASWGRVHDNLSLNDTVAGSAIAAVRDDYDLNGDGTFETSFITPGVTAQSPDIVIDLPGYHQPHMNEILIGYRRQLPGRATIDINAMRREYRNRPALVETNAIYSGSTFVGYRDESRNGVYRLTSNSWNWPVVTALQAVASRDAERWQLIAGYTRSWNRLAGTWIPGDAPAFIQPESFPNRGGIGFITGCTNAGAVCPDSNSLTTGFGGGTWRDHLLSAGGVFRVGWDVQVSGQYTMQSGPWSGAIQTRLSAPDARFGPPTVTLSTGRVVSNPLATPVRFAFATRAEGQLKLPALHLLNVRVARIFPVGRFRIQALVDVINATNSDADQAFQPGAHQQFSPFFGQGNTRQFARALSVSARVTF